MKNIICEFNVHTDIRYTVEFSCNISTKTTKKINRKTETSAGCLLNPLSERFVN